MATTTTAADKSKQYFPLASGASDGWSTETEATATCFCGAVQLVFPLQKPGLVETFVCNCTDCHKITASMFATNFIVANTHLRHVRGQELLKTFSQNKTIASGHHMTNHFCGECGTLMYRIGAQWPHLSILRVGTVDDFRLHETVLKPRVEQYIEERANWLGEVKSKEKAVGMMKFGGEARL
ncbi:Mss4-like protein [Annulohypoxylon maeteangense]|uniref:Mss4-like protein n=1 Tax=Annulohypoxylon maeteangense TaxID=1927788 RepID=UPI00200788F6|nr:Mss4-like protein [Annulohypoxylon maeteangense]KAI0887832.1 Mss4-like protein [Annulohypoxylon maeteangense]